jgi:c(7)-type cytochrome triheme protein
VTAGRCLIALALFAVAAAAHAAGPPIFDDVSPPETYGQVVYRGMASAPAVVFDHWRHRALFTCRLCHVDVGFAMQAGGSHITRETNAAGIYCGACHDGKKTIGGDVVFAACSAQGKLSEPCFRCHVGEPGVVQRRNYLRFAKKHPTYAGGYVDWEAAEGRGLVQPIDFVEGVSIRRPPLRMNKEIPMAAKNTWVGDVIFSHRKHAIWNGCEVCHPEIFPLGYGSKPVPMREINEGKFCGACHRSVAFPLGQCHRCHTKVLDAPR